MTRYTLFPGCKIPFYQEDYGRSTTALLETFDLELVETAFNCCGYPVRDMNFQAFLLSSARNLALAEQKDLTIVTPCQCCYGSLKFAEYFLKTNEKLKQSINQSLKEEGLRWEGRTSPKHLLSVLHGQVGPATIGKAVQKSYRGLKVAVHAGCHALRPSRITQFDHSLAPMMFDELVVALGAESIYWSMKTECCGNPQWDKNRALSLNQMHRKLDNARQSGAVLVGTACTYCQMHFDQAGGDGTDPETGQGLPSMLVSHLIGFSLGLSREHLGMPESTWEFLNRFR